MKLRVIFLITFAVANLSLVLYGIFALISPEVLLEPFSQHVYQFPAAATNAIAYLDALFRLLGFFNIIPGMFGLVLLDRLRASWQAWILRTVIVSTALAYLGPIVFDNTVGSIGVFEIGEHILFLLVIILGAILWRDQNVS